MKNFNAGLLFAVLALSSLTSSHAQLPVPAPDLNATDPLQPCEAPAGEEYKLSYGDQISVDVLEYPALSGKHTVGPDGRITMPVPGAINLAGLSRDDAAAQIRAALLPYYKTPTVIVGVDVYNSDYVTVMGSVEHQGPMTFTEPPTLLSVISRAGTLPGQGTGIIANSTSVPDRVALFCGDHSIAWEDFKQLLENNDPHIQMRLKWNIVVYVPSPNERYVSIFGQVVRPGMVQLQDGATVAQMLAQAGGILTDKAGRLPTIQIIHEYKGSVETVPYGDILKARSDQKVSLQTGDIIYVPESKASRVAVTFEKISPLISIATIGTLVTR